jgi:hypothetical protein
MSTYQEYRKQEHAFEKANVLREKINKENENTRYNEKFSRNNGRMLNNYTTELEIEYDDDGNEIISSSDDEYSPPLTAVARLLEIDNLVLKYTGSETNVQFDTICAKYLEVITMVTEEKNSLTSRCQRLTDENSAFRDANKIDKDNIKRLEAIGRNDKKQMLKDSENNKKTIDITTQLLAKPQSSVPTNSFANRSLEEQKLHPQQPYVHNNGYRGRGGGRGGSSRGRGRGRGRGGYTN